MSNPKSCLWIVQDIDRWQFLILIGCNYSLHIFLKNRNNMNFSVQKKCHMTNKIIITKCSTFLHVQFPEPSIDSMVSKINVWVCVNSVNYICSDFHRSHKFQRLINWVVAENMEIWKFISIYVLYANSELPQLINCCMNKAVSICQSLWLRRRHFKPNFF